MISTVKATQSHLTLTPPLSSYERAFISGKDIATKGDFSRRYEYTYLTWAPIAYRLLLRSDGAAVDGRRAVGYYFCICFLLSGQSRLASQGKTYLLSRYMYYMKQWCYKVHRQLMCIHAKRRNQERNHQVYSS